MANGNWLQELLMGSTRDVGKDVGLGAGTNLNPYTGDVMKMLAANYQNQNKAYLSQGGGANSGLYAAVQNAATGNAAPDGSDLMRQIMASLGGQQGVDAYEGARLQSQDAVANLAQKFAGSGAGRSGAAFEAMSRGAQEPLLAALSAIGQQRMQQQTQMANLMTSLAQPEISQGLIQQEPGLLDFITALAGAGAGAFTGELGSQLARSLFPR